MEWMLMPLRRYADFSGRSRRKEYWMFVLFQLIVFAVLMIPVFAGIDTQGGGMGMLSKIGFGLMVIVALALIVPSLAVQVRRFHDQDKSGWFVLLGLIPYLGGLIVLVFMCLEGTRGANRFGDDPKQA
ncbi:DUF805 domain-containing protein [Marilutibacter chinensis]|uniref:DUF805 domain-containing protein n=1 Tax=Marilutibacter chinensis TaxID=2912247 RepID=A0ABS9HSA3_9GAMM|nr:DUF805 domain-containing protein [Lysobacter chinensis]MCF7221074.1 DUF805 domain-containing protein [Lysobacter chinensis]